jgi:chemotaxis protein MotB
MPEKPESGGVDRSAPAWLVTYADMATLLLAFFVFLFSMAAVPEARFAAAMGSLKAHLGLRPRHGSVVETRAQKEVDRRKKRERERWGAPGLRAKVLAAAQGVRVVLGGRVEFERGSAELAEDAKTTLRRLADELRGLPNIVEVRGHSERGEGEEAGARDDLELSLRRAAVVLRFLADDAELERTRLRAMGAGAVEPADAGLYPDEPARDRRVEIVVVREHVALPFAVGAEGRR